MQSKLTILAVLALLIVACEAPSGGGESPELAEKSAGKLSVGATPLRRDDQSPDRLYRRHCAECHGGVGGGDGPTTRILPAQPGDWTNPGTLGRMDDEQIRQR